MVQMQGGMRKAERGVLEVRRNERLSIPTQQMGLFQQPPQNETGLADEPTPFRVTWWALLGSNQRPPPCEDGALTI